jgi:ubiquinol-cytochrome c reductase iron-sulfur subunit
MVEWRGKPVWVVRRTPEQVAELSKLDSDLADPNSLRDPSQFTPLMPRISGALLSLSTW